MRRRAAIALAVAGLAVAPHTAAAGVVGASDGELTFGDDNVARNDLTIALDGADFVLTERGPDGFRSPDCSGCRLSFAEGRALRCRGDHAARDRARRRGRPADRQRADPGRGHRRRRR